MDRETTTEVSQYPLEPTEVLDRQERAFAMRKAGKSNKQICERLGYDNTAQLQRDLNKRYEWESEFITSQGRESLLALQVARLEQLLEGLWPAASLGDPQSVDKALKVIESISKHTNVTIPDSQSGQATVLVVGGQEADYVSKLKELVEPDGH